MVNWGILGTGSIANSFAKATNHANHTSLVAVASRSQSRADEFAQEYSIRSFGSYESLIEDSEIDAIYIATPHPSHFELALKSLNNKKSVLCEKPITMNATETMVLIESARRNNVLLMEAFMYKTHPQTHKILELVKKELNSPLTINAEFCFSVEVPNTHRLVNKNLGGGSIMDIGCYPLSMSRLLVGCLQGKAFSNPISLEVESELNSDGVDLNSSAQLKFEDGSIANIASAINKETESSVNITDGIKSIFIDQPWHCGEFTNRLSTIIVTDSEGDPTTIEVTSTKDIYALEIEHFNQLLSDSKIESDIISHSDSHGNMVALDNWRRQAGVIYSDDKPENRMGSILGVDLAEERKKVEYKTLLGLDKELFPLVFGCDNQSDSNQAFGMFDHYYLEGGNVFDTAYIYNNGRSDKYLGRWISARNNREEIVVLGKGAHTPDCYPSKIKSQLEETLNRLRTDYLDIYCLHRDNLEIPVGEFIDSLNELKNEGKITVFGASNWSLERFKEASDYAKSTNQESFSVLSNNFSLARMLEPVWPGCYSCSDDDFKAFLIQEQIAIFPWSSQARGFFLDNQEFQGATHGANPNQKEQDRVWGDKNNQERRSRCFTLAKDLGVEPIQVALAFVLHQPFPSFPLIGPRNFFETKSSLKALKINLTKEESKWLDLRSN
jgi:aryl-alcohol dehydrogenase-like predicted oxidoreductase/predicted dehydrogenase